MKAIVIGAHGQVGRALIRTTPEGWQCAGLSRCDIDLLDTGSISRAVSLHAPDVVINVAAYTWVDKAETDGETAQAVNARAVGALAECASLCGAHLVHISTDLVFDGAIPVAYQPDAARNPQSVYGRTKAEGEDLAGARATVIRTSWVYDACGHNFMETMLRLMDERDEIGVVADQIGTPTWAEGLSRVIWKFAATRQSGIWHWSDAGVASWYDFAVAIGEEARALDLLRREPNIMPIRTVQYPTPARRPPFSVLDSSATLEQLDLRPVHWRANLRRALRARLKMSGR